MLLRPDIRRTTSISARDSDACVCTSAPCAAESSATPSSSSRVQEIANRGANAVVTVDLETQTITGPDGGSIAFEIDPHRRHCLLNGLDDIGLTMEKADSIDAFEAEYARRTPWLAAG